MTYMEIFKSNVTLFFVLQDMKFGDGDIDIVININAQWTQYNY